MNHLIFNTTNKEQSGQNIPYLSISMDPKYMYPEKTKVVNDTYISDSSPMTNSSSPDEFGLEHLMQQKQEIVSSKIRMLNTDIWQRYKLKDQSLYLIDRDQCTFKNLINALGDHFYDPKRLEMERKMLDLEQEKRREMAGCFRDILFLKKDLRESEIERLEEDQKMRFFTNKEEVLPWNV
jgi:hypothetical protein